MKSCAASIASASSPAKPRRGEVSWCGREDSNFHGLPHSDLNAARLPVPPRPHQSPRKAGRSPCQKPTGGIANRAPAIKHGKGWKGLRESMEWRISEGLVDYATALAAM